MPPEASPLRDPLDPREWLRRAHSNLARAVAGRVSPDVLYEDACFDAQQAAEKAIKAVLVNGQIEFPKSHSIEQLFGIVARQGIIIPPELDRAALLTVYAVFTRYPGPVEDVTAEDHAEAVGLAQSVVRWAESLLSSRSPETEESV